MKQINDDDDDDDDEMTTTMLRDELNVGRYSPIFCAYYL